MTLLSIENLHVQTDGKCLLDTISIEIKSGSLTGLIGPNGAGKSTFLKSCLKQIRAIGTVRYGDVDLLNISALERANLISYISQDREISWNMTVKDIVELGRINRTGQFTGNAITDDELVHNSIDALGLNHLSNRSVTSLSGGELARVLIARAVAQDTPIILADEPLSGLDIEHQLIVLKLFKKLAQQGRTIICSIHDLSLASGWFSELILLNRGHLIASGLPEIVLTQSIIKQIYKVDALVGSLMGHAFIHPIDTSTVTLTEDNMR